MSKAIELAKKCGASVFAGGQGVQFTESECEAFYHAARAEALREAAEFIGRTNMAGLPLEWSAPLAQILAGYMKELRAMADREGT